MTATTATVLWDKGMACRADAFGNGVQTILVRVDGDGYGCVFVWDSVAQHYTLCHSLKPTAVERIRRLWRAKISGQ